MPATARDGCRGRRIPSPNHAFGAACVGLVIVVGPHMVGLVIVVVGCVLCVLARVRPIDRNYLFMRKKEKRKNLVRKTISIAKFESESKWSNLEGVFNPNPIYPSSELRTAITLRDCKSRYFLSSYTRVIS